MHINPKLRRVLAKVGDGLVTILTTFLRAIVGPIVLLALWFAFAPWAPAVIVDLVQSALARWRDDPRTAVFVAGALVIISIGGWSVIRSLYRLAVRPHYALAAGRTATVAELNSTAGVVLAAVPVPAELADMWRRIRARWGTEYAEWVAARTEPGTSPGAMFEYATAWRKEWVQTDAWAEEDIARHEAAHAVIAHVLGCTVTKVTILPDGDSRGHTDVQMPVPHPGDTEAAWTWMAIYLAGRAVDHAHDVHHHGSASDMEGVIRCATSIISTGQHPTGYDGPLSIDGLVTEGVDRARSLIAAHDAAIDSLTDNLLTADTITGYDLHQVLRGIDQLRGAEAVPA